MTAGPHLQTRQPGSLRGWLSRRWQQLRQHPARRQAGAALLAGAVAGMGQAPVSALWLALPALAVAIAIAGRAGSARQAAVFLWAAGLGYFAVALSWLVNPFLVEPLRHGWMAPFALLLMSGGLALFWALAGWLALLLARGQGRRFLALAVLLTAAELARGAVLTGFPWATLGHIFIGWPPMQLASLFGAGGLTLLALGIAALLAPLVPSRLTESRPARESAPGAEASAAPDAGAASPGGTKAALRRSAVPAGFAVLLLGSAFAFGVWRLAQLPDLPPRGVVRLVQPAIPQALKWDAAAASRNFDTLVQLTGLPSGPLGPPLLTIWPETAFPYFLDGGEPLLAEARAAAHGDLLIGSARSFPKGDGWGVSNSVASIGPQGEALQIYDKHHLVPFGEYVPFGPVLGLLGLSAMVEQGSFTPGPGPQLLSAGALGQLLPLICYEAIFPQQILAAPSRPDWLLQVTNDAWFGTLQGPYQHLDQARLRAVETGLPLLRAANTGVSAAIDPAGRVVASLGLEMDGILDTLLPAPLPPTAYWNYGDLPLLLALALLCAVAAVRPRRG